MEGVLRKIERQYLDIMNETSVKFKILSENNNFEVSEYLNKKFEWKDNIYSKTQKLPVIVAKFIERMNSAES